jgi:hypothetical protein
MFAPEAPLRPDRRRVGVKRSREQPPTPTATKTQVRPALDADPGERTAEPTMTTEGRGAIPALAATLLPPPDPTSRPPSLLTAPPTHSHNGRSIHELLCTPTGNISRHPPPPADEPRHDTRLARRQSGQPGGAALPPRRRHRMAAVTATRAARPRRMGSSTLSEAVLIVVLGITGTSAAAMT